MPTQQMTDEDPGFTLIPQRLRGGTREKLLGLDLRVLNEALWPQMALNPGMGPADLHLLGFDYFAETLPGGGYRLTRVGL